MTEPCYAIVNETGSTEIPTIQELKTKLEKGSDESKIIAMRSILTMILNGDPLPQLLMDIIRFVMPSKNKALKKLLMFYWEICPKTNPDGKLKQEMILVCNAIRNDLQHPNEYIRGSTLRFLCKLKEPDLLEPLLPSCRSCLDHRHSYVRKNAALAIFTIYQHSEHLIPDAPELLETFLENETDSTCKRNAFVALASINHQRAGIFFNQWADSVSNLDEILQLSIIDYIKADCLYDNSNRSRNTSIIFTLLEASSHAVVYEAASTLPLLTSAPTAIQAAASTFLSLCVTESDNNVKLTVLDKVESLRVKNLGVLDSLTMEILRVLSSTDMDVRKKALAISLEMVSVRNVEEVVMLLKKELLRTIEPDTEDPEYRHILLRAVHSCAIKFSEVAASVVDLFMSFLSDLDTASAANVLSFVKELIEKFPHLRSIIVSRIVPELQSIKSGKVLRGSLWIIGEYSADEKDIKAAWLKIRECIGELPILASETRSKEEAAKNNIDLNGNDSSEGAADSINTTTTVSRVLPDGTYATESYITNAPPSKNLDFDSSKPNLRRTILEGDYYLASVLASTLVKLVLQFKNISSNADYTNLLRSEAMLIMISIIRAGQSDVVKTAIDEDSADRIMSCIKTLGDLTHTSDFATAYLENTREAYREIFLQDERLRAAKLAIQRKTATIEVDDVLSIRQLSRATENSEIDVSEIDLSKPLTFGDAVESNSSKLNKVVQLTGYSDPVYAEAYVKVSQFDIILDVLLVNQTMTTLQNLIVEFATLGDLKVVGTPATQTLGPHAFYNVQAVIKVSSTDTGVIFGNIVYDGASANDSKIVILDDVHVDIMDYIHPAECSETEFRTMWTEFEWENKVNISYKSPSLKEYFAHLLKSTNMSSLTPESFLDTNCRFFSANLYAQTVFGEDALANVSIEKEGDGPVVGHVRIRSKGQGLALSLGDRIAASQRPLGKA